MAFRAIPPVDEINISFGYSRHELMKRTDIKHTPQLTTVRTSQSICLQDWCDGRGVAFKSINFPPSDHYISSEVFISLDALPFRDMHHRGMLATLRRKHIPASGFACGTKPLARVLSKQGSENQATPLSVAPVTNKLFRRTKPQSDGCLD